MACILAAVGVHSRRMRALGDRAGLPRRFVVATLAARVQRIDRCRIRVGRAASPRGVFRGRLALRDDDSAPTVIPPSTESVLLRLVWMVALPAILLCVFLVGDTTPWTFGARDVVLVCLVIVAIAARAADALWYGGTTAHGEPATRSHVVGYAIRLVSITAAAWLLAQSIEF